MCKTFMCFKSAIECSSYCSVHKCNSKGCSQRKTNNYLYCDEHLCRDSSYQESLHGTYKIYKSCCCEQESIEGFDLCARHKCGMCNKSTKNCEEHKKKSVKNYIVDSLKQYNNLIINHMFVQHTNVELMIVMI